MRYALAQAADLTAAILDGADLRGADFTGAILLRISLKLAEMGSTVGLDLGRGA